MRNSEPLLMTPSVPIVPKNNNVLIFRSPSPMLGFPQPHCNQSQIHPDVVEKKSLSHRTITQLKISRSRFARRLGWQPQNGQLDVKSRGCACGRERGMPSSRILTARRRPPRAAEARVRAVVSPTSLLPRRGGLWYSAHIIHPQARLPGAGGDAIDYFLPWICWYDWNLSTVVAGCIQSLLAGRVSAWLNLVIAD